MRSHELKARKRAVRREVLARRDATPVAERIAMGRSIHSRFLELDEVRGARSVMLFWSFGSEVPTEPLIEAVTAGGATVALPAIDGDRIVPRAYVPGAGLSPTAFGAMEPSSGPELDPASLDVVCTPGVAFDRSGRRVGYGGGFYDRFLPAARSALWVGLAFGLQVVGGDLPNGAFDLRIEALVTERETLRWPR